MDVNFWKTDVSGENVPLQCLQHRALNPDDPLPALCPQVEASLKPPQEVVTRCTQTVCRLEAAFSLEPVGKDKDKVANVFVKDDG